MKYALLIHVGTGIFDQLSEAEKQSWQERHAALQRDSHQAGHYAGSVRLAHSQTAVSVRTRGQEQIVIDGPFAETKEVLVGFYLIDCETLEEALAYAKCIPVAPLGTIEVRAVGWIDPGMKME